MRQVTIVSFFVMLWFAGTAAQERIVSDADWIAMNAEGLAGIFPGDVTCMATCGKTVYYVREGTCMVGDAERLSGIVTWDGTAFSSIALPKSCRRPLAATFDTDGMLYVAFGNFPRDSSPIRKWDGSSWSEIGSPVDNLFISFESLTFDADGNLYTAGSFDSLWNGSFNGIARWDGTAWNTMGDGFNGTVYGVVWDSASGSLYAHGDFDSSGGTPVSAIARWNGEAWLPLGSELQRTRFPAVQIDDCTPDGKGGLYVSGNFILADSVPVNGGAYWNGTSWDSAGTLLPGLSRWSSMVRVPPDGLLFSNAVVAPDIRPCTAALWNGLKWEDDYPRFPLG